MLTLNPISPTHFTTRMGRGEPGRRVYNGMHAKERERQRPVAWPWFRMKKKTQNPLFFPRMTFKPRSDGARDEDRHFYGVFLGAWESVVASLSFLCMGRRSCILHTTQKRLREVGKKIRYATLEFADATGNSISKQIWLFPVASCANYVCARVKKRGEAELIKLSVMFRTFFCLPPTSIWRSDIWGIYAAAFRVKNTCFCRKNISPIKNVPKNTKSGLRPNRYLFFWKCPRALILHPIHPSS